MSDEKQTNWIVEQFKNNSLSLVLGGVIIFTTMQTDTTQLRSDVAHVAENVEQIQAAQTANAARLDALISRQQCQATTVERLSDRAGIRSTCAMQE